MNATRVEQKPHMFCVCLVLLSVLSLLSLLHQVSFGSQAANRLCLPTYPRTFSDYPVSHPPTCTELALYKQQVRRPSSNGNKGLGWRV